MGGHNVALQIRKYKQIYTKKSIRHTPGSLARRSATPKSRTATAPNVLETARGGHVLGYTSGCWCHRLDLKDVACVNMRDSS
ncbi:hypothetical protein OH76DRAFT_1410189 [Lentinus brumalis]|uniref:Uncharacterized protein n=1 Tax=Lentinus brumalis TaxID=2498619 RepID=A0A371CSZ5_9APHY|nr:hypothetical protein OH76DRAFT_1410189 [Polyporus brumalis]